MEGNERVEGRAELSPNDVRIESFETVHGTPAVMLRLPGVAELTMAPESALAIGSRLCCAAVAGASFRVVGESETGPHDLAAAGAFFETMLQPTLGTPPEKKPN